MKKILFVCTGNCCRSVMAEGLLKRMLADRSEEFEIKSAGVNAIEGFSAPEDTIEAMRAEGIDVTEHQASFLTADMVKDSDIVFTMEEAHKKHVLKMVPEAKDKVYLLTEYSSKVSKPFGVSDIPDPVRMSSEFHRKVLIVIKELLQEIVGTI